MHNLYRIIDWAILIGLGAVGVYVLGLIFCLWGK